MSRTAISGSPDLVSGRSNEGGEKDVDTKEGVSTITTTADPQLSCTIRASNTELKRSDMKNKMYDIISSCIIIYILGN